MSFYKTSLDTYTEKVYHFIPSHQGYNNNNQLSYKKHLQRPGSFNDMNPKPSNFRPDSSDKRPSGLMKLNEFRNRVSEAIQMSKKESTEVRGEFDQVLGEERQVYNMLVENPVILQRVASYPDMPHFQQGSRKLHPYNQKPQKPQDLSTPFEKKAIEPISQLSQFVPKYSQVRGKQSEYSMSQQNPYGMGQQNSSSMGQQNRNSKQSQNNSYPQQKIMTQRNQPAITFGSNYPSVDNLKRSLNQIKNAKEFSLSDDAFRMIQEIERKAFDEIQKLRREKLLLMQKLNQQINNANKEKRKNTQLTKLLKTYTNQAQHPDGSYLPNQTNHLLQTRIQQLSSELQRANQLNNLLRLQFSHKSSGVPAIEGLLRQGETIRQDTLKLIKLKEHQGDFNQKVQDLERRLAQEQAQKEGALNELRALKQKPTSGSRNRPFQQVQSYQRSVKVTTPFDKSATQYEDLVSQMKRITGF